MHFSQSAVLVLVAAAPKLLHLQFLCFSRALANVEQVWPSLLQEEEMFLFPSITSVSIKGVAAF